MSIVQLPHTADVALKIEGALLTDLFKNGLKGMNSVLKRGFCETVNRFDCQMHIEIDSYDNTSLLIDFLSEVLALSYIQKAIFCEVYFSYFSEKKLVATIFGTWFSQFDEEVKAITYHEAHIHRNESGLWETHLIFDV